MSTPDTTVGAKPLLTTTRAVQDPATRGNFGLILDRRLTVARHAHGRKWFAGPSAPAGTLVGPSGRLPVSHRRFPDFGTSQSFGHARILTQAVGGRSGPFITSNASFMRARPRDEAAPRQSSTPSRGTDSAASSSAGRRGSKVGMARSSARVRMHGPRSSAARACAGTFAGTRWTPSTSPATRCGTTSRSRIF